MPRVVLAAALLAIAAVASAQSRRIASPPGSSAVEVLGRYDEREGYVGGKWIEITYGRPIKRGRDLFGPPDFAEALGDGADVWRAGANVSTQLKTEVPLILGGKTVAPGTYTMFIDLKRDNWTLIVSTWPAQTTYDYNNKQALWGAYDYTPDRDVVRVPMTLEKLPHSFDQLSWQFLDMTETGGTLAVIWDRQLGAAPFAFAVGRAAQRKDVSISSAWVKLPAAGATSTDAYVIVDNPTMYDVFLQKGSADAAGSVEFRETGKAEPLKFVTAPAYDALTMDAKGVHLLLKDLKKPLVEGDKVQLTLVNDSGVELHAEATVKKE